MQAIKDSDWDTKWTVPNLQVIEEQVRICKVEDHFFHHQADAHGRRGVLEEREGKVAWWRGLPMSHPVTVRQPRLVLMGSHAAEAVSPCRVRR